jgi:hypothetical protein
MSDDPSQPPAEPAAGHGRAGDPVPHRSGPEPAHDVRFFGSGGTAHFGMVAECAPCEWTAALEGGHTLAELARLEAQHAQHARAGDE